MTSGRVAYIDGLRGWAALSVMLFHVFWETLGTRFPEVRHSTTSFFLNGPLAVFVFFILSGDALSHTFIQTRNIAHIQRAIAYRYFRLAIPVILSCAITYALLTANLSFSKEAAEILNNNKEWLGSFTPFTPSLTALIKYSTFTVFAAHTTENSYNPFLWTMSIELIGSLLVFAYLLIIRTSPTRITPTLWVIAFFLINRSFFCLFFVGVLFAQLRATNQIQLTSVRNQQIISVALLSIAFIYQTSTGHVGGGFNGRNILGALFIVSAVHLNPSFQRGMSSKLSKWLGEISFPLYLVHFSSIISIVSFLVVWLNERNALTFWSCWAAGVVGSAVSIVAAQMFMLVEQAVQARVRPILFAHLGLDQAHHDQVPAPRNTSVIG